MSYYYYFSFGKCVFFNIKQYFIFERNFRDLRAEVKKFSSGIQTLDGPYKMYLLNRHGDIHFQWIAIFYLHIQNSQYYLYLRMMEE